KQIIQDPLPGQIDRGKHRIQVDEAKHFLIQPSDKQHRLFLAESRKQKAARRFHVRRLAVKLPVSVEQRRDFAHISERGLTYFQTNRGNMHWDKGTRRARRVNSFCAPSACYHFDAASGDQACRRYRKLLPCTTIGSRWNARLLFPLRGTQATTSQNWSA